MKPYTSPTMETDRLRKWLGMPPGDWPPADGELLGLPGEGDGHERAMLLMEKLRPHQLLHPELVTEGMNRLAQALIQWEKTPLAAVAPVILEAEVIETRPVLKLASPAALPRKKKRKRTKSKSAPLSVEVPTLAPPPGLKSIEDRRKAYRQLAQLRRLTERWQKLGPYFGVPSQELITTTDVLHFIEAAADCRRAVLEHSHWPARSGHIARGVVSHQAAVSLFRSLQLTQRQQLAGDWALAMAELQVELQLMRESLRQTKTRPRMRHQLKVQFRRLLGNPAWLIGLVLIISLGVALLRTLR